MNDRIAQQLRQRNINEEIIDKVSHSIRIAEAMNEPLWLGDRHHRTIYVNPVYERLSGYTLEECIGKPSDFCFSEESKRTIADHHRLRDKGIPSQYEATMVAKDGTEVPILVSGAPTSEGGTIGIFLNLTNLKHLAQRDKIGQQIIKNATDAIVVLDEERKIQLWSTGAAKMFGYKEEKVLSQSIDIIVPETEREHNIDFREQVELKHKVNNAEARRLTKNGEIIDVCISATKILDESSNFIGYLVIYSDITQQKRASTELQKRFETIQDAYKELGVQKRQLDYMAEIVDAATSETSLRSLQQLIVSALCLLTKSDAVILRTLEPSGTLKLQAGFGVDQKWWDKNQIKLENSLAEEAFKHGRPLIIDEINANPRHQSLKLLKNHRFKTLILIPLIFNKELLGTISLYSKDSSKFRLIETDFLEKMGRQCTLALYAKSTLK